MRGIRQGCRKAVVVALAVVALSMYGSGRALGQDVPLTVEPSKIIKVDRTVVVPTDVLTANVFPFKVSAPTGGVLYRWQIPSAVIATSRTNTLEITHASTGEHTFTVEYVIIDVDFDKKTTKFIERSGRVTVLVGDVPNPGPGPKPDPPKPDPPKPATGLRVLMVGNDTRMTREQLVVWNSTKLKSYLDLKCAKGSDGRPEWRKWDKDTVLTKETPTLMQLWKDVQAALAKAQPQPLPLLIVVTDTSANIMSLPVTEQAVIEEIKKRVGE